MAAFVTDLDTKLLQISLKDFWTLRDACDGTHIWGGIGSGKSSGSGNALRDALLRAGLGFLVMVTKPEEIRDWIEAAKRNGRADSVIVFDGTQGFNFITYELARQGAKGIGNVIDMIMRICEAAELAAGNAGAPGEMFWTQSMRQLVSYTVPAIYAAYGTVTVTDIMELVTSAATKPDQYLDPQWSEHNYAAKTLRKMVEKPAVPLDESLRDATLHYFFKAFTGMPEKTRGSILIALASKLDRFKHGRLRDCFCSNTTIVPEMTFGGAIILMAMPAMTWNEDGIIGQHLFKYVWQRAVESRNGLPATQQARPVALWADESQYWVSERDEMFLSTCRGSKACVVFLTQTLPTYYARLGHTKTAVADGLVGKFNTQIFHLNACHQTNEHASKMIGRDLVNRGNKGYSSGFNDSISSTNSYNSSVGKSSSINYGGGGGSISEGHNSSYGTGSSYAHTNGSSETFSHGSTETMDNILEPNFFATKLKSGGPKNKYIVTAVWFKAGATFHHGGGRNFMVAEFKQ